MFSRKLFYLIIILGIFTRFIKIDWGNGNFFHPDENNMAIAISQLSSTNLNPNFFAYGQFPLYLGYFTIRTLNIPNTFANSIYILRLYSALFSVLSVFVFYLIANKLSLADYSILFYIFCPGLIQLAHFGTTESLLVLIFLLNIYFSFKLKDKIDFNTLFLSGLINGIGVATKISALAFTFPIFVALFIYLISSKKRLITFASFFTFILIFLIFGLIFSPYNIIDFKNFLASMSYETGVANGSIPVFYTTQFKSTLPYIFQFRHIFPYALGLPVFVLSIFGLYFILNKKISRDWVIVLLSTLTYFIYFGQLYVKWTRFMSPLFFVFILLTALAISKIKIKTLKIILIIIACLPGIYFLSIYFQPDIRVSTSKWIESNLPANTTILSESGNVVNLPLTTKQYSTINYDFYDYDKQTLSNVIFNSDYIIVPSRRVFKNYSYPYYLHLFNGSLGFKEIKKFDGAFENAEETWSVFDRPTIRIYQKIFKLSKEDYEKLL